MIVILLKYKNRNKNKIVVVVVVVVFASFNSSLIPNDKCYLSHKLV